MDAEDRAALLRWYRANARDLPWRRTRDPYAIWVSEAMLQQTRVDVATPYFERWMRRFPTVQALAAATLEEVLEAWSGLGYYNRARNLHAAARQVVDLHGGRLPADPAALRALPGFGPYTAGAVASIAHGVPVACVDGNVVRVACRLAGIAQDPRRPAVRRRIEALAASWVPSEAPGDWNQALMELGATVCKPRSPGCGECPVRRACAAAATRRAHLIPRPARKAVLPTERLAFAVLMRTRRGGKASVPVPSVLLVRNPPGLLGGLWSLPGGPASEPLAEAVRRQTGWVVAMVPAEGAGADGGQSHAGLALGVPPRRASVVHAFSHRRWRMDVVRAKAVRQAGSGDRESRWVPVADLPSAALPAATWRALQALGIVQGGPRVEPPPKAKATRRRA